MRSGKVGAADARAGAVARGAALAGMTNPPMVPVRAAVVRLERGRSVLQLASGPGGCRGVRRIDAR